MSKAEIDRAWEDGKRAVDRAEASIKAAMGELNGSYGSEPQQHRRVNRDAPVPGSIRDILERQEAAGLPSAEMRAKWYATWSKPPIGPDTRILGAATGTEGEVCKDIAQRQAFGMNKYGVSVRDNPLSLRQWLEHLYQEQLDACVYTKRCIEEIDGQLRR